MNPFLDLGGRRGEAGLEPTDGREEERSDSTLYSLRDLDQSLAQPLRQ